MQTGELVTQFEKRTPSAAIRSRLGVRTQPPLQPIASHRNWSVRMNRMFGFVIFLLSHNVKGSAAGRLRSERSTTSYYPTRASPVNCSRWLGAAMPLLIALLVFVRLKRWCIFGGFLVIPLAFIWFPSGFCSSFWTWFDSHSVLLYSCVWNGNEDVANYRRHSSAAQLYVDCQNELRPECH